MIWIFEGNIFFLLIMLAIMMDNLLEKGFEKTKRETSFFRMVLVFVVLLVVGFFRNLAILYSESDLLIQTLSTLYSFSFPLMLSLWLYYETSFLVMSVRKRQISLGLAFLPLFVFFMLALLGIKSNTFLRFSALGSLLSSPGEIYLLALCIFYSMANVILVIVNRVKFIHSSYRTLLVFPVLHVVATQVFIMTDYPQFLSASIVAAILMEHFVLKGLKVTFDSLTGLPNRQLFVSDLTRLFSRRETGCIVMTDIINFKAFNQKFGQHNGNLLLKEISEYLLTISTDYMAYRVNGDQFVLLLKGYSLEQANVVAKTLLDRFAAIWMLGNTSVHVDIRVSLVVIPDHAENVEDAINAVDYTLTSAKASKTKIAIFSNEMLKENQRKVVVLECLKAAIENNTLALFYQPVYSGKTSLIVSAEALLRLHDDALGDIEPSEFIPIAEENGLIENLTYWVVNKVCDLLVRMGSDYESMQSIAINLSSIHFLNPDMESSMMKIIEEKGVDPHRIGFEITETMVIDSFDRVEKAMNTFSAQGISFSLDDYGKGYSNIEYLIKLPFDTVKLDRSIINHYDTHEVLLDSLVLMLHRIGKHIVAEGVETEEQNQVLHKMGIDLMQGYLFAKPMDDKALLELLSTVQ